VLRIDVQWKNVTFSCKNIITAIQKILRIKKKVKIFTKLAKEKTVHSILQTVRFHVSNRCITTAHSKRNKKENDKNEEEEEDEETKNGKF
jgi:ribosomal protein L12E/L44/L45/RPP1/RPP2